MIVSVEELRRQVNEHAHGRVPRDLRHAQVLGEARQLFVERGYRATSMDDLASRVGVSKPVVYDLVGAKDQLFGILMTEVADELEHRLRDAMSGAGTTTELLDVAARAFFGYLKEEGELWLALFGGHDTPTTEAIDRIRGRQAELVAEQIMQRIRIASPTSSAESDPEVVEVVSAIANTISGAFEGLARWWAANPGTDEALVVSVATLVLGSGVDEVS